LEKFTNFREGELALAKRDHPGVNYWFVHLLVLNTVFIKLVVVRR